MTPWWVPVIVAMIGLTGIMVNNAVLRSSHRQQERQWEREQSALEDRILQAREDDERKNKRAHAVDIYKWATTMSVSGNMREAQSGVDILNGLLTCRLLDPDMEDLVVAAAGSALHEARRMLEAAAEHGIEVRVINVGVDDSAVEGVPLGLAMDVAATEDGSAA